MLQIEDFWKTRLAGARAMGPSKLVGWISNAGPTPGFVEPTLTVVAGDPDEAKLLIVAAPGAVGKSSYAQSLASTTNSVVVDLAKTSPLGGNFFSGGLANAFGAGALAEIAQGKVALVVDALDEAEMRAGPRGYEAGLLDLANLASEATALPAVLLGRALAAEEAYLLLSAKGHKACLLQVEFFDETQASRYLRDKLALLAKRYPEMASAYEKHGPKFCELAEQARQKLFAVAGNEKAQFAGYAPVLDAICEFTLEDGNPQAKIAKLNATSQIELIDDITLSILEREQGKVQTQFRETHPEVPEETLHKLYTVGEQLQRLTCSMFGGEPASHPSMPNSSYETTYQEMVERFSPQHPFLSANGAANPVFAAYVVAWALRKSPQADLVRKAVRAKPKLVSGIFFDLYDRLLKSETNGIMPLADVGILYQALNSQIVPGQRVQLEVSGPDNNDVAETIEISFTIMEKADPDAEKPPQDLELGPYVSTSDTILELRSPFSNVYVDAPTILVELGDGEIQQIGAPTQLVVDELMISAKQLLIHGQADEIAERRTVSLIANEADCTAMQQIFARDALLSVAWPGAQAHPWNGYAIKIPPPVDSDIGFLRRRLRRILTAFRSHSKGALVRLAAKINSVRMTKDERGIALVEKLVDDGILVLFDVEKFYRLDPDVMGKHLSMGYHDLAQSRFTPESDSYLMDVLRISKGNKVKITA